MKIEQWILPVVLLNGLHAPKELIVMLQHQFDDDVLVDLDGLDEGVMTEVPLSDLDVHPLFDRLRGFQHPLFSRA